MSGGRSNTKSTNSSALKISLRKRTWRWLTCTRMRRWNGVYGAAGMQASGHLAQWEARDLIDANRASVTCCTPTVSVSYRISTDSPTGLGGVLDRLQTNCL